MIWRPHTPNILNVANILHAPHLNPQQRFVSLACLKILTDSSVLSTFPIVKDLPCFPGFGSPLSQSRHNLIEVFRRKNGRLSILSR